MTSPNRPGILMELGHLQVFGYQSIADWTNRLVPTQVFWKIKNEPEVHGPFPTIYFAVQHYSEFIAKDAALQRLEAPANLIMVDFKSKKRLN